MTLDELLEQLNIGETQDVEFKKAEGGLPKSIWQTISAFANTEGGTIFLGVTEYEDNFTISGVRNYQSLIKDFWNTHNNAEKISFPICIERDVQILKVEEKTLISIYVPQATRQQRPVYINNNLLHGSYKRHYDGDYHCTDSEIKQMLRDADNQPADNRILEGFTLADLDRESLRSYRQRLASINPNHTFLASDDELFLDQLGGWREDRITKKQGITLAGLLMFGTERSLQEALPYYHLDYQEKFSTDKNIRWDDRITLDGTWQPNLYNFYYRAYSRLTQNIKVPFKLDKHATRQDETHVHEALREALVNTLVHSDHEAGKTITILQHKDAYIFRNAGRLRISKEQLYRGGNSDPRNPALLKMFRLIGLADRAGTGFLKILHAWREQHRVLAIREDLQLNTTELNLSLISFMPQELEQHLNYLVGKKNYESLDEMSRSVLFYIYLLQEACNEDLQLYRREHPRDISTSLKKLVELGCLEKSGYGRGTKYRIRSLEPTKPVNLSSSEHVQVSSTGLQLNLAGLEPSSTGLEPSSTGLEPSSTGLEPSSTGLEPSSTGLHTNLLDISTNSDEHKLEEELQALAKVISTKKKVSKTLMQDTILSLCSLRWITLYELASLLNRSVGFLRDGYIKPLLKDGKLQSLTPDKPNNPKQAYKANKSE